ncbi:MULTISPECIES: NAD(P)-dependent oxidoreductase [unclassified Crossiella]|uniref:NAD(P)-dependent oxidoreductase n=1 Tax=unclassified Crossiella TaxID=2620835 RepID=UPI002000388C|nr:MULTISPECIES: NAD(P)-binding domain-containing protein [unclassified Crossiella]MCK2238860.1 NAD(P)-binding domain-containing protein [Crossiella sp. S99.2]MCK2251570.1 NAD(P)-binding domain-containing protein [Crossiella sp. S99.1]
MPHSDVTVLGLGQMGSALAAALLRAGHQTTVWNRTTAKSTALAAEGAQVAATAAQAQAASPVIIACVLDYPALHEILDPATLAGRTLVNLTSGSPEQARETAAWAARHGIGYLDGGIMITPPGIGNPASMLLYSGPRTAFTDSEKLLSAFGEAIHLGEDPGVASLYDTALLGIMWATMTGWLHAAALVTADGATAAEFTPLAIRWLGDVSGFVNAYAQQVDERAYPGFDATIDVQAATIEHLVHASEVRGIDAALPKLLRDYAKRAVAQGHGSDGWARVIELLRSA